MKIALIGYGKMGKAIEKVALEQGHSIVLKISSQNAHEFTSEAIGNADVAIEFSTPHTAFDHVKKCLENNIPVVCGSTAWLSKLEEAKALCHNYNTAFIYASNFSIGVNIFFEINKQLASIMNSQADYDVSIKEIHHTQKLDAPSGTAVTLAEDILSKFSRKHVWVNAATNNAEQLSIISERIDPAPGTHHVSYSSAIDDIEIIHTAHSREGFAKGAVLAAAYLNSHRQGVFSMKDVLGI
jgi:4-hydroxy-tetrahydrodipicolinate reductase